MEEIDEDTLLFVMGDHGMTSTGDHGGDSVDEVTSALFIYSKKPLSKYHGQNDSLWQVSLVPTLSAILGVPIPFSNLGTLILNALPDVGNTVGDDWQLSLFYLWSNLKQVLHYIDAYSVSSPNTFKASMLTEFKEKAAVLDSKIHTIIDETSFNQFSKECIDFLATLRHSCEEVWVQFDSLSMTRGLLILFFSMFFVYMITDGVPYKTLPEIFDSSFLVTSYFILFISAIVSTLLHYFSIVSNLSSTIFVFTGISSQFMLAMLVFQNWDMICQNWYEKKQKEKVPNLIFRLILILHLCGLFSNSFVVEEGSVLLFLLNTVILIGSLSSASKDTVANSGKKKETITKTNWKLLGVSLGILVLVRFSSYFWRCRDKFEQPWCVETVSFTSKGETTKFQWAMAVICLGLFVTVTKTWLRNCGNLNGYNLSVTLLKYVPTVLVVCMGGFWVFNRLPSDVHKSRPWQANFLAWLVYGLCGFSIAAVIWRPLCIYVIPTSNMPVNDSKNVIPQLFKKVKKLFDEPEEEVPVMCGLATVYSAVFLALGLLLTQLFALLLGDAGAPSSVIMFMAAAFVLIVTSAVRLEKANSIGEWCETGLMWLMRSIPYFLGVVNKAPVNYQVTSYMLNILGFLKKDNVSYDVIGEIDVVMS